MSEVKWLKNFAGTNIGQVYSTGMQYCFLSEDFQQCHPLVFCKDFLQDAVMAFLHEKDIDIYSFKYKPKTDPSLYFGVTRLAIAHRDCKDFGDRVEAMLDFVNQFAKN